MTNAALQRTLDGQRTASDPATSAWVAANAGAGKTTVLVNRVVRLMLEGTPPARILCLTFTKAAAAEMSNRIFKLLGAWSILTDEDLAAELEKVEGQRVRPERVGAARLLFAKALETPGGLKIQTIHAFCQSILGRFPLEARIVPHFDVLDEYTQSVLLDRAQMDFLEFASSSEEWVGRDIWQQVIPSIGEGALQELISEISANRFALQRMITKDGLTPAIERAWLGLGFNGSASPGEIIRTAASGIPRGAMKRASDVLSAGSKTDVDRASQLAACLAADDAEFQWDSYKTVFLTKEGAPRKTLATKKVRQDFPSETDALEREQLRVVSVQETCQAAALGQFTEAMLHIADQIIERYEKLKRFDGVLDYDDLIKKTADMLALQDIAAWVLYKLDGGIDHILVDEAQDTNPLQWEVIQKIADEFFAGEGASDTIRTIFAVGDEKQSIYSFQGADPSEFDRQRSYFEAKASGAERQWSPVDLILSFRSTSQILEAVDTVFGGEALRQQLTAAGSLIKHEAVRLGAAGRIELWPAIGPNDDPDDDPWDAPLDRLGKQSPPSQVAERIANTISGWLTTGEVLPSKNRPIRPSDIFILVRRRNSFVDELIRRLKISNVPVAGIDRMVLTEQIAVMDLMVLADFALLPEDDLTLATVLRSPLVDLSEDYLFDLAVDRDDGLWKALADRKEENEGFGAAHAFLAKTLSIADHIPPFEFFTRILNEFGGRVKLVARLGPDAQDPIDEFLRMALDFESREVPSLQGFLDWIRRSNAIIQRDMDHGRNEVRIMTVHGAKGLEANIVFLPDTCGVPSGRHDARLQALDAVDEQGGPSLYWVPNKSFDAPLTAAAREAARAKRDAEFRRLFYVAMTRASDRLYICGYEGKKGRSPGCWYDLAEDAIKSSAQEVVLEDGTSIWRIDGDQTAKAEVDRESHSEELVADWRQPYPPWINQPASVLPDAPLVMRPSHLGDGDEGEPVHSPIQRDDGNRFKRGRLVHKLLELLPEMNLLDRREAAVRFLAQTYLELTSREIETIVDETLAVLQHEKFAGLFGPGSKAEVPLAGALKIGGEAVFVNGQVDRLLVGDDRVWVVDYKTNRPPPTDVTDVNPLYVRQMAVYCQLLATLFPNKPVECALLWTDGPRLMHLPGEILDKAGASLGFEPE